jgi:hypothetical protein
MVHFVLLQAPPNVVSELRRASDGFYPVGQGQYILGMNSTAVAIRDWLRTLGATRVVVLPLRREWATFGANDITAWLQRATEIF